MSSTETIKDNAETALCICIKAAKLQAEAFEYSIEEMRGLLNTAGVDVVDVMRVNIANPNPRTFLGKGKVEEIAAIASELEVDTVVLDADLTPTQQHNLTKLLDCKIVDRTAVILDIFAQHAHTREGKLQVELAQLKYILPRLSGKGIELSRLGGGIGTRGPGETKLEMDRRRIRQRIDQLNNDIVEISRQRRIRRKKRSGFYAVSLIGYTNAGKSSLLNALTSANAYVEDQLFATLDSMTRRLIREEARKIVLTDTVGFIDRLPPQLIAAFGSTLEEASEGDLILHVVDAGTESVERHIEAVNKIIDNLGWSGKEIIMVFNKIDLLSMDEKAELRRVYKDSVFVSATARQGLDLLIDLINKHANQDSITSEILVPYSRAELLDRLHKESQIIKEEYSENGIRLEIKAPAYLLHELAPFLLKNKDS